MGAGAHVAIVDDDDAIRRALSSLLRSEKYRVSLFDSAEAFLADRDDTPLQCLLTDVQLPGLSGLDLQALLRMERPSLPVVIMTAYPHPQHRDKALMAGAVCFLSKPFEDRALLRCIEHAVEHAEKGRD